MFCSVRVAKSITIPFLLLFNEGVIVAGGSPAAGEGYRLRVFEDFAWLVDLTLFSTFKKIMPLVGDFLRCKRNPKHRRSCRCINLLVQPWYLDVRGSNMKHAEIWDDSALIQSWDEALEEYEVILIQCSAVAASPF